MNLYETEKLLEEYLLLHYGTPEQVLPWAFGPTEALGFPARCVTERVTPRPGARALEIGCAVGRACFELSRFCDQVIGIDFSRSFIEQAQALAAGGEASFEVTTEGELRERHLCRLEPDFRPDRVSFEVGDATALRADLGSFDIVLACNLLCRIPDPQALIRRLPSLLNPGGQLVLTSPYTWMEQYTPRRFWLGGFEHQGLPVRTLETLRRSLAEHFELKEVVDMPFLIREHGRKFQWSVSQATVWARR